MDGQTNHADQRKKLNTMNPDDRKMLEQEMIKFLFEGHDIHIDGYTPEK